MPKESTICKGVWWCNVCQKSYDDDKHSGRGYELALQCEQQHATQPIVRAVNVQTAIDMVNGSKMEMYQCGTCGTVYFERKDAQKCQSGPHTCR